MSQAINFSLGLVLEEKKTHKKQNNCTLQASLPAFFNSPQR